MKIASNSSSYPLLLPIISIIIIVFCISSSSSSWEHDDEKIRAVSLGGWLVTEGWIKPSLFHSIPNNDLLDGTQVRLKSVTAGKYVSAESGGGSVLVANRTAASAWETFRLWRINETTFSLRVFNGQFVGLDEINGGANVVAVQNTTDVLHTFQILRNTGDPYRVRIRASNGLFLQAKTAEQVTADYSGKDDWGEDNPSVFTMENNVKLQGEFQLTNGYGPLLAPKILEEHWRTFIVEDDFKFISSNGLNAVRIPVGWWIASDPNPPKPFVGGSLKALDNAFSWASKYGVKVIVDLHAAPGSQNGWEHSSSRDGSQEWGKTKENIRQTVAVIDFLTARYAENPSLYAVELINEPLAPGVQLETLTEYYKAGYEVVRKYSATAHIIMSNRLGPMNPTELFGAIKGLKRTVIDVHYYQLFSDMFDNMTAQQTIDYVSNNRSVDLGLVTPSNNGPLSFVGEWVAEWNVKSPTKEDYQRYAQTQLQVFGNASFGWAYWTLKNVNNHWSLEWMIKNGYIKL
ncbi:hypothetical protein DM860_009082 [Cuscuta australis]|uniref:Uncharacterized protein n=1 Tax=Cuscuta australis TaxID=267555 RepID=A0A328D9Q8_9ASTE|nr:hypothetical protein DM860_009082 [Cuscuta australis]